MRVYDLIAACDDGKDRPLDVNRRRIVIVHRSGMGDDAVAISRAFQAPGEAGDATGHQMPYTFVITRDGAVEQALRIGDYGPHALSWSIEGIGVALVGDMREEPPTGYQRQSLIRLCSTLGRWLGGSTVVWGHDELVNASRDPNKECPGRLLCMDALRRDIDVENREACEAVGIVF